MAYPLFQGLKYRSPYQYLNKYPQAAMSMAKYAAPLIKRPFAAVGAGLAAAGLKAYNSYGSKSSKFGTRTAANRAFKKKVRKIKKGKVGNLASQVKELSKRIESLNTTLTYRWRSSSDIVSASNNQSAQSTVSCHNLTDIETVLGNLKYFNPSVPDTLITVDFNGAVSKQVRMQQYSKMILRNNYQAPVNVRIYKVTNKVDTNLTPTVAFTNGLADIGNPSATSCLVYPTDSPQFNDLWKIQDTKKVVLQGGQTVEMSHSTGWFDYDPSVSDSHASTFQKSFKAYCYLVRVEGTVGHDNAADEQGTLRGGVDMQLNRTYKVKYNGGVELDYIIVFDDGDTFTNTPVVSLKPVSDNLPYSLG